MSSARRRRRPRARPFSAQLARRSASRTVWKAERSFTYDATNSAHAVVCLSESIPIYAGSVELGCLADALEAVAAVLTQLNERRGAAFLLGGAEELRTKSGHAHRPWELHSRDLAEEMLASDEMEAERERGRAAATDALVARATALLERAHLLEQPT